MIDKDLDLVGEVLTRFKGTLGEVTTFLTNYEQQAMANDLTGIKLGLFYDKLRIV